MEILLILYTLIISGMVAYGLYSASGRSLHRETLRSGQECFINKTYPGKSREVVVSLGVPVRSAFSFSIRRETAWHRWLKSFGFAEEVQTGDPMVDSMFYFMADNPEIMRELLASGGYTAALLDLFKSVSCQSLECRQDRIWLTTKRMPGSECTDAYLQDLLNMISTLAAATEKTAVAPPVTGNAQAFSLLRAASVYDGVHGGLFLASILLSPTVFLGNEEMISIKDYLLKSAGNGSFILLLWFLSILVIFRGTSRFPQVLGSFLLAGVAGIALTVLMMAREINVDFDHAPPDIKSLPLLQKSCDLYCRGGRYSSSHTYILTDQQCAAEDTSAILSRCPRTGNIDYNLFFQQLVDTAGTNKKMYRLRKDRATYQNAQAGDYYLFPVHQGYLQLPWIRPNEVHQKETQASSSAIWNAAQQKEGTANTGSALSILLSDMQARLKFYAGDYDGAKASFDEGCRQNDFSECFNAAEALWAKGDKAGAKPYYVRSCELKYPRGCGILGDYALEDGNAEEAGKWYKMSCDMGEQEGCRRFKTLH